MTHITQQLLKDIVERLVQAAQPEQIILFGSFSRDEAGSDSDLDLLVIESDPFTGARSRLKEIAKLERAIGRIPVPTDILVYSREEVENRRHSPNHVIYKALRRGSVLYARP